MWTICRRDLLHFFTTPLAWLVLACWTFLIGGVFAFFELYNVYGTTGSSVPLFITALTFANILLTFLAPALTMNSFAREKAIGTMQLLLSAPIKEWKIIGGKFLASFSMLILLVVASISMPIVLWFVSSVGIEQLLCGYLGIILSCAFFASLGIWISLLLDNTVSTYVITFAIIVFMQISGYLANESQAFLGIMGKSIGITYHIMPFIHGDLRLEHVVWFLALTLIFLLLAYNTILMKRK